MKSAFEQALVQVWQPMIDADNANGNTNRQRITILLSDGKPSVNQNPCEVIQTSYVDADISVTFIDIGDAVNELQCSDENFDSYVAGKSTSPFYFCLHLTYRYLEKVFFFLQGVPTSPSRFSKYFLWKFCRKFFRCK